MKASGYFLDLLQEGHKGGVPAHETRPVLLRQCRGIPLEIGRYVAYANRKILNTIGDRLLVLVVEDFVNLEGSEHPRVHYFRNIFGLYPLQPFFLSVFVNPNGHIIKVHVQS